MKKIINFLTKPIQIKLITTIMEQQPHKVSDRDFFTPKCLSPVKALRKQTHDDLLVHSSPYYEKHSERTQDDLIDESLIVKADIPFTNVTSRICSLAVGRNLVYMGTVGGHVQVALRSNGELKEDFSWRQLNTPIEGIMYDYEGKVVYGTEYNLVVLDKNFKEKILEVKSYEPLRTKFM